MPVKIVLCQKEALCLQWPKKLRGFWDGPQWKRVLFSDESVFQAFFGPKKKRTLQTVYSKGPKARVCHGIGLCQWPWPR